MLVVKIEVWPAGRVADAFEIGRMEVVNDSGLSAISDYSAHIVQRETSRMAVAAFDLQAQVRSHPRSDGPWSLVKKVLDQLRYDRPTKEQVAIDLPTELVDRADALATQTGRERADIIQIALSLGLRGEERTQSTIDALDDLLAGMTPDTFSEAVEFGPSTGTEAE